MACSWLLLLIDPVDIAGGQQELRLGVGDAGTFQIGDGGGAQRQAIAGAGGGGAEDPLAQRLEERPLQRLPLEPAALPLFVGRGHGHLEHSDVVQRLVLGERRGQREDKRGEPQKRP